MVSQVSFRDHQVTLVSYARIIFAMSDVFTLQVPRLLLSHSHQSIFQFLTIRMV
jgi:hypothetical protein